MLRLNQLLKLQQKSGRRQELIIGMTFYIGHFHYFKSNCMSYCWF